MKKLDRRFGIYAKQYKGFMYTIERLNNTKYGHPNFEIVIYQNVNKHFDIQGAVYHVSTYENVNTYVEKFIDNNLIDE